MDVGFVLDLCREEQGQDLVEYTLLLALFALLSAGLFLTTGQNAKAVWTTANVTMMGTNTGLSPGL
jgi:Flp pilus assembly pilin Flp